jgi:cellulase/cellobiase CelA1
VQAHAEVHYDPAGLDWSPELTEPAADPEPPPPPSLTAVLTYNADWGGGFCKNIEVTNQGAGPATTWSVALGGWGYSVYFSWNSSWSGNPSGPTLVPTETWNQIILPGETDGTVGFCAYRTSPWAFPVIASVQGSN